MNRILDIYPGDETVALIGAVVAQVTLVCLLALACAVLFRRRNAAWQFAFFGGGLVAVLASPLATAIAGRGGWVTLPIPLETGFSPSPSPAAPPSASLTVSREGEIVDIGTDLGILEKVGTWYSFADIRIGQGRENAKDFLKENPEVLTEIQHKILKHYNLLKEMADECCRHAARVKSALGQTPLEGEG